MAERRKAGGVRARERCGSSRSCPDAGEDGRNYTGARIAHAVAEALRRAPSERGKVYVVNVSGRGDKDTEIFRENMPELDA